MAELTEPTNAETKAAISCIIESLYNLIHDLTHDQKTMKEHDIGDEQFARRMARIFHIFALLTRGELGDYTKYIMVETSRQARERIDTNNNETTRLLLEKQLPGWFSHD